MASQRACTGRLQVRACCSSWANGEEKDQGMYAAKVAGTVCFSARSEKNCVHDQHRPSLCGAVVRVHHYEGPQALASRLPP